MRARLTLAGAALVVGCAGPPRQAPQPVRAPVRFQVLGNASPSDTGPPTLRMDGRHVTIRGLGIQVEGGSLYGDVDLSEPHTLRLTLYDSLPGRPVADPPVNPIYRQVIYEALIGPLAPGPYDVWVGRFDAKARMVEVAHRPLHIKIEATSNDSAGPKRSE
ncbi:MAG: hypothetical protein ABJC36_00700 [Gemmatimonadales bacterium]